MSEMLYIDPTSFRAGGGKFRSDRRYLSTAQTGAEFPIARGHTMMIDWVNSTRPTFRYSVNGYVQQRTWDYNNGIALDTLEFDADVVLVRTEAPVT